MICLPKKVVALAWKIELSRDAQDDLRTVFIHLFNTHHRSFGHDTRQARDLAASRIKGIEGNATRLIAAPHIGTKHIIRGVTLRHVTFDRAVYWFEPDASIETVRIIGIFYGGQDHLGRMLARLTAEGDAPD